MTGSVEVVTGLPAWSLMAVENAEREFAGNLGYGDVFGERYAWDSNIANSRRVQAGDLAVLRNKSYILGIAWIDQVDARNGAKAQRRCPTCHLTGFKPRKHLKPAWWCPTCQIAFENPVEQAIEVTIYAADYARSWRPLGPEVASQALASAYIGGNNRHSIRELAVEPIRELLSGPADVGPMWWAQDGGVRPGGYRTVLGRQRIGQAQFRAELLSRFRNRCAISGDQPPEILEAAHLYRYAETPHHDSRGGLLLRRDLHALFDKWLLAIDPADWTIRVAPKLLAFPSIAELDGRPLDLEPQLRPDPAYLHTHLAYARDAWLGDLLGRHLSEPVDRGTSREFRQTADAP